MNDAIVENAPRIREAGRVRALDGVRGMAIFLVLMGHGINTVGHVSHSRVGKFIGEFGHLGVDVFFVLSGFLITTLLVKEKARSGRIDFVNFYRRRVKRIFPAYWFFLAVVGALSLLGVTVVSLTGWMFAVFYLTDYSGQAGNWWTGHTWSLAIEEQFYLLWPLVIATLGLVGARRFAIACIVLAPLVRILTYVKIPRERDYISVMFHTRLDVLMVGSLLAILLFERKLPLAWTKGALGAIVMGVALVAIFGGDYIDSRYGSAYRFSLGYTVSAFAVAAIIAYVVTEKNSLLSRALATTPIVWLGRISYSLYLWQQLFLTPENRSLTGRFPINIVIAIAVATLSFTFIETRFYRQTPVRLQPET